MKIYLAGSFTSRFDLRPIRDRLWELGHDVVSTWLDESIPTPGMTRETFERKLGLKDLVESAMADLVIVDLLAPSTTGGRYVEYGLALGRFQRQLVWLVGPLTGVFHYLADEHFDSWAECLAYLAPPSASLAHGLNVQYYPVPEAGTTPIYSTMTEEQRAVAFNDHLKWLEREGPND